MPAVLKFYGACVVSAAVFSALVMIFGAPRSRESLAVVAATVFLAVAVLWIGYIYAQTLAATGAKRWVVNLVLIALVASPAAFISIMPLWGPVALAVAIFLLLLMVREKDGGHAP